MVLGIVGFVVVLIALYIFFEYMNKLTYERYTYEFFSIAHMLQVIIGYWLVYFGSDIYMSALKKGGDLLNGQLLIFIGVVVILVVIYKNFKAVPFFAAVMLSVVQLFICIPLSVGVFLGLIMAMAFLAETKPVYVLND